MYNDSLYPISSWTLGHQPVIHIRSSSCQEVNYFNLVAVMVAKCQKYSAKLLTLQRVQHDTCGRACVLFHIMIVYLVLECPWLISRDVFAVLMSWFLCSMRRGNDGAPVYPYLCSNGCCSPLMSPVTKLASLVVHWQVASQVILTTLQFPRTMNPVFLALFL